MANTSKRGFASMEGEKQRIIASKGGKAAHAKGTAHEWSSDEARAAGRKGGESRGNRTRPAILVGSPLVPAYDEHALASNFLSNAGRSLRSTGATPEQPLSGSYEAPGTNPYPLSNASLTKPNYQTESSSI